MYKIKFDDLTINSNNKKILKKKTILFFYGLGCSGDDFDFLIRSINKKFQILIPELPGHHCKTNTRNSNLDSYTKKIFLLSAPSFASEFINLKPSDFNLSIS